MLPFAAFGQTEQELAAKADALFKKEQYVEATSLYLRLLSLNPRDHNYNYRYGTCLLFNSDKKQDAFKYLNFAVKGDDVEIEAFYFLGKAYHLTFEFNKAIDYYKKYKNVAGSKAVQRLDVDRQIEMCQNGKRLLSHISEVIVLNRKLTGVKDFFRLYDLSNIGGTIIVTEEFQTKLDKKNEHVPLIHFPANPTQIYYSSYGDDERTGKDIYVRRKLPDGSWGQAQKLRGGVNTRYDEDYPYMHPNGKFLYFCSKGHNSMGGYDVFRAPYFPDDDSFGDPENLDFAISSPDDDLFYVVDSLDRNAYFASARQSQDGKIHVYQVRVQKSPNQLVVFKGNFVSQINPSQKVIAVQIKDLATGRRVGSYKSNAKDGSFLITLPKGGKYEYSMQIEGSPDVHLAVVEAPFLEELKPLKQRIIAYMEAGEEQVRVENLFNEQFDDISDILAEVLKGKAQLQPNSEAFDLDALDREANQKELLANLGLQRYNPQELSELANQDVARWERENKEVKEELSKLLTVADRALKASREADSLAEALLKEAGQATNAARIQSLIDQASAQKFIAQKELENANQALAMHKVLEKELQRTQENLVKAKEVARVFTGVNAENLKDKITEAGNVAGEYIQKHFNKSDGKSAAQRLYEKADEIGSLSGLNKKRGEVQQLQETIRKRELEINKLEKEKEFAKKKELEEIERRISKLQADNEVDLEMIRAKNREIEVETKNENELIAKKTAIDRTRDISESTINRNLTPDQLAAQARKAGENVSEANLAAFTRRIKELEADLANATVKEGGVSKEIQRDPKDVTQKQPDTQAKEVAKQPVNQVTVKPTSEDVARLNPQLKQREDNIRTQDLTVEEKAEAQLGVEKQWVVELAKEINKKEQELKANPIDAALKREVTVLKETLAEKKQNIENLKQVAPKETPREKETSELVAQVKPDYEEQKKKAQANPNVGNRLNQLNANDKKLIAEIEERLENLSAVNTPEAKREKELLAQRLSELKDEVEERNRTINLLADSGEETRIEDPKEEAKVDALPSKIKADYTDLQNKLNKAQTPAEKNAVKRELQTLLSAVNSELFKAEERVAQNPQDKQRQAEKQALEELVHTLEGDLERVENTLVAQQTDPKIPSDSPEVRNAITEQTKQLTAIEQRNNRLADAPDKANTQRALLKELDQLIAESEKLVQNNPTQSELKANLAAANQLKIKIEEELRQTELAQQDKQVASSGTIRDNAVNQLTAKSEQQRTANAPISEQIRTKEDLLAAITKAEAQLDKDLKKNPSDAALLAEKQALDDLKDKTRDEIAELRQTELAQQDKQVASSGTIRDNTVNQLTAKSEQQRTANAPISEQIRTKEELVAAITKAEAQLDKDLKKNPSDVAILAEKQALDELKDKTRDEIAELRQTELAQQDKQVASSGTIRDNAVNQLTAKSEQHRTANAPISEQIRTKEELVAAITKAEAQLDKDLKKNPSDAALLAEKQTLDDLKDKTRDEIAELRQTELAQQDKQVASSGTIRDNAVNQLTAKSEQQRAANAPISDQIRTKEDLLAAITKAEAQLDKDLKKNPSDAALLAEKQTLDDLKDKTRDEIAELRQTELAQQDKQVASSGTIRDNAVNQLTAKSEQQRTANAPISEQIRTKEELMAAITKAEAQLDKDLKKNPSDAALLAEKQALDDLKDKTRDEIAELRQTELAQQDKQVASTGTIRNNAVNQLTAKSEQQRTANAPISEQIRTKEELMAAITKAEAQLDKELKKNPSDSALLAEKQALAELKTTTQTELTALRTTQTDAQRDLTNEERIAQIDWKDAKGIEKAFNAAPLFESVPNEPVQLTNRMAELMAYRKELEQLAAETSLSSAQRKAVEQEIKRVDEQIGLIDRLLNELVITFSPEKGMVQTNDPKINALQNEFVQTSAREAELTAKLNDASPSDRKQLEKELAQVQAKRQQLNADLVVAQKAELTQQTEAELRKVEQADATDPMLILQARQTEKQLEVTQQAIESVEGASKKQRNERAEEAAQERNELLKRVDELATYQAVQEKAEEVLRQSGLTKEQVFGTDAEAYALEQLKLERNELEAQIRKLRAEQQTASKKRIPIIEVEIGQMTMEVEQLNKAIADLEAKGVQPVVAQTTTNSVVKQNQAVNYAALSEKEVLDIAREKEYVKVSNQINELQLLENQLQNKQLEEANLRNQVVGKIKRAAVTYDQAEAAKLEREAAQDAVKLAQVRKEIEELRKEITAVDESIRMNPLWNKGDQQKLVAVALAGVQPVRQAQTTAPEQQTGLNYIAASAASTTTTPIAMNPKLPGGIVYKVQVGAFARPVPDNTFKEFAPVSGEQVNNSGLIRYMVGLFADKGSAYQAQARVRSLGYKDAFVVAFCDGERMTVAQADQLIREGKCKLELFEQQLAVAQSSDPVEQASAIVNKPKSTYQLGPNAAPAEAVEDIPGLFFTVQVGVYNTPVSPERLFNINPLNTNLSEKGQIRYSTGRFDDVNAAIARRNEVRQIGVLDAFVTAYYNGVRITVADARKLLEEKGNGILASELVKLVPAEGEIGIVLKPVEDTRRKLNDKLVRTVFVSEDTYTYYPQRELDALRKANWVYYDELTGRIVSLPKSEIAEFAPWPDAYPMKAEQRYQGFTWDQSRGLYLESIDQDNPTQPWHVLEVTWEGNLGQLAAVYLQHAPFAILDWNAQEGRIVFGPLTYARKEELKQVLQTIPFIQLSESLLVWE
jgi:hypothetical protein